MEDKIKEINRIIGVVGGSEFSGADYKAGLINGLIWAGAIIEGKEPEFININYIKKVVPITTWDTKSLKEIDIDQKRD